MSGFFFFLRYVCANTAGHCVLSAGDIGGDWSEEQGVVQLQC